MDSLSQFVLGSAVAVVVMRHKTAPWKALLVGGLAATLPDLDSFYDFGDPVSNMTMHRADSHSLFWLTLLSPLVAFIAAAALRDLKQYRRWWLAVWLALFTHPILDWFTVYGTQLLRPFTDHPYGIGSMFIIDPFYTLPLLIGIVVALILRNETGWRVTAGALAFSTLYLGASVVAQNHVRGIAEASLRAQGQTVERLLVTPAPLNIVLWRVVAVTPDGFLEGFRSLADSGPQMTFDRFDRGEDLYAALRDNRFVQRIAWFSHGFFKMTDRNGQIVITDLRMGQEPNYSFNFVIAKHASPMVAVDPPLRFREQADMRSGIAWLWRRARGEDIPPRR
jgi:inner membrane protein